MRVLLARRFRGNRNEAQLLEEEGEDPQAEVGEDGEEEGSASIVQFSQGQQSPQQAQSKAAKNNTKSQQPREKLLFTGKGSCENISPQQSLSVVAQKNLKPSPQRKRRLAKSSQEEIDCKLRRLQHSVSSTTNEEASLLDRKPSARGSGIVNKDTNRTSNFKFKSSKVFQAAGENTTIAENSPSSPISETAALPTSRSNPTKENNTHNMVSSGAGRNYQRGNGNSRQREEEEHLLNWQYNHHPHHAVGRRRPADREEAEIIVQPSPEAGFEGPLENDPASARGDVSSASPERQSDDNGHSAPSSSSSFVIGRREGSPSLGGGVTRNRYDNQDWISSIPRNASIPRNRREIPAYGSKQGTNLSKYSSPIGGNSSKKRASSAAEEIRFREVLKKERGLEIREQDGDGNCLFRAISLQVYGDPSMHGDVRKQCMDHMERDQEHFSQFVTGEPFLEYVARTRQDGVHGNNPEIQASSELFNRPIEVFTPENGSSPLNIFHAEYKTGDVPIRLSYHDGNHYNAVIDPLVPTAGLGLGLPGLKPGYADKMQMAKAVAESMDAAADQDETELQQVLKASQLEYSKNGMDGDDDDELQRAIKESQLSAEHMNSNNALSLSDMDATYFELEQAALEQSLQSFGQKDEGKKRRASTTAPRVKTGDSSNPKAIIGDHKEPAVAAPVASSATASLPCPSQESIPLAAAAASSSVASAATLESESPQQLLAVEEYPSSVQELVMNGFPLSTVVKAFDLVGNNFDHMLSLCLANANNA